MSKELMDSKEPDVGYLMAEKEEKELPEPIKLDISHIVTEDDTPVDNLGSEKHQRLLTNTLYSSWKLEKERKYLAAANVGVFDSIKQSPIVPDMFISLDVEVPQDLWKKENRSYFLWEYGKPPDLVVEIVSNKVGGEITSKLNRYARMRVLVYVVYDPMKHLTDDVLTVYKLSSGAYQLCSYETEDLLPNLRVTFWDGEFEGTQDTWLRWTDSDGHLLLTGEELAIQECCEKEQALEKVEQERREKEQERREKELALEKVEQERFAKEEAISEMEKLAAKLRELGIDPKCL